MRQDLLKRLLAPRSIALVGGVWADPVAAASRAIGYEGQLWRVHPSRPSTAETQYYRSIDELPGAPDATFLAAPAGEAPAIATALARRGAGGFVCFAAGFSETGTDDGQALTRQLVAGACELPFLGPNCYGFINFFEGAALWPDQVVGTRRERGVALICQSGTIALSLSFNHRSVPIGYVITVGNQTCLALEDLIELLADDPRITAFGLYIEGIRNVDRFVHAAERARDAGKPIALVKAGRTEMAARTAHSHTGALAGADVAFDAYCRQAGIARCETLASMCETLKVLHLGGPLAGRRTLIMGASGGDMAMTADVSRHLGLDFAAIPAESLRRIRQIVGPRVTVANPFDFHTHLWFDRPGMRSLFEAVQQAGYHSVGFMVDTPPADQADPASYVAAIEEFIAADPASASRRAVICSLPESMSATIREQCLAGGVVPLQGQREALEALDLAACIGETWDRGGRVQLCKPQQARGADAPAAAGELLAEHEAKAAVAGFGVPIPQRRLVASSDPARAVEAAESIGYPVVIKATGRTLQHKSELGGVVLNVRSAPEAEAAAQRLAALSDTLLVEQMVTDGVAEILVGITVDAQFGQLLVLGAGGTMTELLKDTVALLPPFTLRSIHDALARLGVAHLLAGYRGKPAGDVAALVEVALACTRYAESQRNRLLELDLNPVIVRPTGRGAIAVDALIRLAKEH
ncbi:MAG TPA: acetate--CoA ligase family protein [Steroidobacteraceae bacterium]|jgi:acetyl-CoA synthetase